MKPSVATTAKKKGPRDDNVFVRGNKAVHRTFLKLCELSGSPLALKAYYSFKNKEYLELLKLKCDPFFYEWNGLGSRFDLDYQIVSFFKKYVDFDIHVDREGEAYGKWVAAEERCRVTNEWFRSRWDGGNQLPVRVEEVFYLTQRKIVEILGTIHPRDLDFIRSSARHGPGADTCLKRRDASLYSKFQQQGEITPGCAMLYDRLYNSGDETYSLADFAEDAILTESNRLSFVPKTALIDRAICIEPRWNVYLQLGIGALISKRLRRYGQDILCQGRNQRAARAACTKGLSTIDLSSASDSISTNLVIDLLSCADPLWVDLLLGSRSHYTVYNGRKHRLEKISSMGNGYTFPLETLIFYCFAYACCQYERTDTRAIEVYGDDIIIPRSSSSLLIEVLEAFGFSVNTEKSYTSGSFYESCGCDYFEGREVRPFFLKKEVSTLFDLMVFHNQIVSWSSNNGFLPGLYDSRRWLLADDVFREVPVSRRYSGPSYLSGVFHRPWYEWTISASTARLRSDGIDGFIVKGLVPRTSLMERYGYRGHLYSKLSADLDSGNGVPRNEATVIYRVKDIYACIPEDYVVAPIA